MPIRNSANKPIDKQIIMYSRRTFCPGVALARDLMQRYNVTYHEVDITSDETASVRLQRWTNSHPVPTLIVANEGEDVPYTDILPLGENQPLKGQDRGPIISEPTNRDLENWLHKHGFLSKPYTR